MLRGALCWLVSGTTFAALALQATPAAAACAAYAISTWPDTKTVLPTNGRIVLEGYGQLQDLVLDIARHTPALVSKDDRVPLNVSAVHRGQLEVAQAVLVPVRELTPGAKYTLEIQGIDKNQQYMWTNGHAWGREPLRWQTASAADKSAPRWSSAPSVERRTVTAYGCGPAEWVHVRVAVHDDSAVAIRVTLRPKDRPWPPRQGRFKEAAQRGTKATTAGEAVTYIVPIEKNVARVGHGMCSGAFALDSGRFTALFTALDAAGNESPAPGGALEFSGPDRSSDRGEE